MPWWSSLSQSRIVTNIDPPMPYSNDPGLHLPFFRAPPSNVPPLRRLLLISFHFPPSGATGALRWQKLSRFAVQRGWALDVISLHPSELDKVDDKRLADLPPETRVYGVPMPKLLLEQFEGQLWRWYRRLRPVKPAIADVPGPGTQARAGEHWGVMAPAAFRDRLLRRLKQIVGITRRGYFAWMDYYTHGAWADEVTRLGLRLLEADKYEVIITCGPPHMAHEAGRRLAERTGLPLVVDLRDPWRLVQRLADGFDSALWYRLAAFYERRVVARASLIVMNTARAQNAMQAVYPSKRSQIIAVMNGYDEEPSRPARVERKFIVAYAGAIYLDRDPTLLLEALAQLVRSMDLTPSDIGLEFMGHVESHQNVSLHQLAEAAGIADYVRILGPGSRDAALEFLSHASILVSLPLFSGRSAGRKSARPLQQDSDMAIPAKIFDYMQFDAWILAIAQRGSATDILLRDSGANIVAPDDLEGMTEALTSRFRQHRNGARPVRLSASMPFTSRRVQAALLFDAIDKVVRSERAARVRE